MAIAKVTEIIASSAKSFEDAVETGIARADKTLKNVRGAWIAGQKVVVEKGKIKEYRVTMRVTFVLEDSRRPPHGRPRDSGSGEAAGGRAPPSGRAASGTGAREGRVLLLDPFPTALRARKPLAALSHPAQHLETAPAA